jgi:hypothetical protein
VHACSVRVTKVRSPVEGGVPGDGEAFRRCGWGPCRVCLSTKLERTCHVI